MQQKKIQKIKKKCTSNQDEKKSDLLKEAGNQICKGKKSVKLKKMRMKNLKNITKILF